MEKQYNDSGKDEEILNPDKIVKKARKSRKVRHGRRKQSSLRKSLRFFVTIFLFFALIYIAKMPQWYLSSKAFTTVGNNSIVITNNKIVKPHRILAFLKLHKVPGKPIYMMKTSSLEKDIKKLPPVKDVYIRRYAFPARLQIVIKERTPIITIAPNEKAIPVAAYADDGTYIGKEYLPFNSSIKTVKILSLNGQGDDYRKWTLDKINELVEIAEIVKLYANEPVEYIDLRNPNDVYIKIKSVNIRVGKLDAGIYERLKRIPSILPKIKLLNIKIKYVDISWEKVNYLKLVK